MLFILTKFLQNPLENLLLAFGLDKPGDFVAPLTQHMQKIYICRDGKWEGYTRKCGFGGREKEQSK